MLKRCFMFLIIGLTIIATGRSANADSHLMSKHTVGAEVIKTTITSKQSKAISELDSFTRSQASFEKDGLYYKELYAVDVWDSPKKYGYQYNDIVYDMIGFEQKYNADGDPIYTKVVVPEKINGHDVVGCADFSGHTEIESVTIKADLSKRGIDGPKVRGCTGLKYFEMLHGTSTIGCATFKGCIAMTTIKLGKNVREINERAFENCTSLRSLNIPKSVKIISFNAFKGCTSLKRVNFEKFSNLDMAEGLRTLPKWSKRMNQSKPFIYDKVLVNAGSKKTNLVIKGKKVSKILFGAFQNSHRLRTISIQSDGKVVWGNPSVGVRGRWNMGTKKKVDIFIYGTKIDKSIAGLGTSSVVIHVPKKMVKKYKKYLPKSKIVNL